MTKEEKLNYMSIAAGVVGYTFEKKGLDMLVSIYDLVLEKGGNTDLWSISKIKAEVTERDNELTRSELWDKVSKKV